MGCDIHAFHEQFINNRWEYIEEIDRFDISESKFGKYHQMGARVTSASNQEELERSLRALLEADITKLEGN